MIWYEMILDINISQSYGLVPFDLSNDVAT